MNCFKRLLFCLALGSFALTLNCGEEEETTTETPAETTPETTETACNNDGTCDADAGETTETCADDCPAAPAATGLCAGESDTAYRDSIIDTGARDDTDCAGNLQNSACGLGGSGGAAALACAQGTSAESCGALNPTSDPTGCNWFEGAGCILAPIAACGANTDETACGAAAALGCAWAGGACIIPHTEDNCTATNAVLAAQGLSCDWSNNMCWSPKKGADVASGAAATCGFGCLANSDPVTCSIDCMKGADQLGSSLTDSCLTCYAGVLGCVLDNCLLQCSATSTKCDAECSVECQTALADCSTCRATGGCTTAFTLCADG